MGTASDVLLAYARRQVLVEACRSTVRPAPPIAGFYQRIKARRGHSIAIVASARKLRVVVLAPTHPRRGPRLRTTIADQEERMRRLELQAGAPRWQGGRDVKRKTAAKQTLEQALALLKPLDAAIWVSRARDELGRIGLRRAAVSEGLTPAQTRVAELAARGLSNQEIAIALYMSTRALESHLTKIYREYGVRSRAQLIGALAIERGDKEHANLTSFRSA